MLGWELYFCLVCGCWKIVWGVCFSCYWFVYIFCEIWCSFWNCSLFFVYRMEWWCVLYCLLVVFCFLCFMVDSVLWWVMKLDWWNNYWVGLVWVLLYLEMFFGKNWLFVVVFLVYWMIICWIWGRRVCMWNCCWGLLGWLLWICCVVRCVGSFYWVCGNCLDWLGLLVFCSCG